MPHPLRVGIVGAGAVARAHHLPGLAALEDVSVVSVANRTEASSRAVAAAFGVPRIHSDWRSLVTDPDLDAVVIGTWPDTHVTVARAAIEADKHVLVEGRLAHDHRQARALLETARALPHVTVMVVPAALTFWADRTIQRLLAEEVLGRLVAVEVRWGGTTDLQQHPAWRRDRRRSGINVMELGILVESVARWVGFPRWVQAIEQIVDTDASAAPPGFVADVPDLLDWQGELPGGALVRTLMSPHLPPQVLGRTVSLTGSEATLVVDLQDRTLRLYPRGSVDGQAIEPRADEPQDWRVEAEFVGAIRQEEPVRFTDLATAERYMAVTDAVRRAARTGRRRWVA